MPKIVLWCHNKTIIHVYKNKQPSFINALFSAPEKYTHSKRSKGEINDSFSLFSLDHSMRIFAFEKNLPFCKSSTKSFTAFFFSFIHSLVVISGNATIVIRVIFHEVTPFVLYKSHYHCVISLPPLRKYLCLCDSKSHFIETGKVFSYELFCAAFVKAVCSMITFE